MPRRRAWERYGIPVWRFRSGSRRQKEVFRGRVAAFLDLLVQNPFLCSALIRLYLNANGLCGVCVRDEDIDTASISKRNRRDEAATRQFCGHEVFTRDTTQSLADLGC